MTSATSKLQLYVDAQYASPYAMSAFVALREKALVADLVTVDLDANHQHQPDYATVSLTHRVPTLVDGTFTLSESSAIAEYLDERFPGNRLYSADALERARAREVQAWIRSDLMPIRRERSTDVVFYGVKKPALSDEAKICRDRLVAAAERLIAGNGRYIGREWCIADIDLAMMLMRLIGNGDQMPATLVAYAELQWQRPSLQAWMAKPRPALV